MSIFVTVFLFFLRLVQMGVKAQNYMEKNGFQALKADQLSAAVNKTDDYFHNSMFGATTNASQEHGEASRYNSMRK